MIDTLMVLWTSGMWKRLLRNTAAFLLLFLGICVVLFFITTNGSRWSSLAVTVGRSNASNQANPAGQTDASVTSATVQPAPVPTALSSATPYIEPIILQNPILPDRHANRSVPQRPSHRHIRSSYPPPTQSAPANPPPDNGFQDPSNPMQGLP